MYKSNGTYQIVELSLTDFTFYVRSIHQNLINSTTVIEVIYNQLHSRDITAHGVLTAQQAINYVKGLYDHTVINEQDASSVPIIRTTNRDKLTSRRWFGEKIVNDFLEMRLSNPTNIQEDAALSTVLMPIALSLQLGSLGLALGQISQLQPITGLDMNFVAEKVTEIQTYLSNEHK